MRITQFLNKESTVPGEPWQDKSRMQALQQSATEVDATWHADELAQAMTSLSDAPVAQIFERLTPFLIDHGWLKQRIAHGLSAMHRDPFFQPPVRFMNGASSIGLVLEEIDGMTLSLIVNRWEDRAQAAASQQSVIFTAGHTLTHVIKAGRAHIDCYSVRPLSRDAQLQFTAADAAALEHRERRALCDGETIALDQQWESYTLSGGTEDIVLLQLFVPEMSLMPLREYDADSGRLLRLTSSRRDSSFRQMALTVLRELDARDALPLYAEAVQCDDFALRWQAMREWLAFDLASALPELQRMAAGDVHPEVRRAATATLDIVASRMAEADPCH